MVVLAFREDLADPIVRREDLNAKMHSLRWIGVLYTIQSLYSQIWHQILAWANADREFGVNLESRKRLNKEKS
jgi:hypothetical protein